MGSGKDGGVSWSVTSLTSPLRVICFLAFMIRTINAGLYDRYQGHMQEELMY